MKVEPIPLPFTMEQAARSQIEEMGVDRIIGIFHFPQRFQRVIVDRSAEAGDATQQTLSLREQTGVRLLEDVVPLLNEIAADVQPPRGSDVSGLLEIVYDQARQQAQAEWM